MAITVPPSAEVLSITQNASKIIEQAGRTCYKSEDRIDEGTEIEFILGTLIKRQHLSVLEHASATIRFVTDRGVTHEMVRHRLASFCQESTRYCNYGRDKFGGEISVIEPPFKHSASSTVWDDAMQAAEAAYLELLTLGESPQIARSVLPTCLKAEIVMTCNFREWLHVFALRTATKAHPQIQEIMVEAQRCLACEEPAIFEQPHITSRILQVYRILATHRMRFTSDKCNIPYDMSHLLGSSPLGIMACTIARDLWSGITAEDLTPLTSYIAPLLKENVGIVTKHGARSAQGFAELLYQSVIEAGE